MSKERACAWPEATATRPGESTEVGGLCCGPEAAGEEARPAWWKVALALSLAGQIMMFSLGYNNTPPEDRPEPGGMAYLLLHGGLATGAAGAALWLGWPLWRAAGRALRQGRLTLEILFALSLGGAFAGSALASWQGRGDLYYEVVPVVVAVYRLGQASAHRSQARLRTETRRWRDRLRLARVRLPEGGTRMVPATEAAAAGWAVSVLPGEILPVDGWIRQGVGLVRDTALTGEPAPVVRRPGDRVRAGAHLLDAELEVRPDPAGRTIDALLEAVEAEPLRPGRWQERAHRLIRWFVPAVAAVAVGTGLGWWRVGGLAWWEALYRGLTVLLVACPCALGLATPLAIWSGLERLGRLGMRGGNGRLLEGLAEATHLVFDKTGTLTEERLTVVDFLTPAGTDLARPWLRAAVAAVERDLPHPVARAWAADDPVAPALRARRLVSGFGVEAEVARPDGSWARIRVGEAAGLPEPLRREAEELGRASPAADRACRLLAVLVDDRLEAVAGLAETARAGLGATLARLRGAGLTVMVLTGDSRPRLELPPGVILVAGLSPLDKRARLDELARSGARVLYVGDGLNDAPALAGADSSLAVTGGAPLAVAVADGQWRAEDLTRLPEALAIGRAAVAALRGNLVFSLVYNGVGMGLAAAGWLHPVAAALLMGGSSAFVASRALRACQPGRDEPRMPPAT